MAFSLLLQLFFITLLTSNVTHAYKQCLERQKTLLLELKNELVFDSVHSTKLVQWNQRDDDYCSWEGVECDGAGHVISLHLDDEGISGGLNDSSSLFSLEYLEKLNLDMNNLSTAVPDFFANFSCLTSLSLFDCSLTGYFPEMIFQLPTLQNLDLSDNPSLSGTIPQIPPTTSFRAITLERTNFSGSLPDSIDNLKNLSALYLSECRFSGLIPSRLSNLTELVYVDLSQNFFAGSISAIDFDGLSSLVGLDLSYNSLSGSIPISFDGLSSLVYIDLSYNSLSGSIPISIFTPSSLEKISLQNNQFSGQINEFLMVNVSNLFVLDLSSNQLQGPIPDSFFQLQSLCYLVLSNNFFRDTFQLDKILSLPNLTNLDLSNNNLSSLGATSIRSSSDDFPDLVKQSVLRNLDLSSNHIAGEIPSWIWEIGNGTLENLNLSCNMLVDLQRPYNIPTSLFLNDLDLHSNQLRGELPLSLLQSQKVDCSNNYFDKFIPPSIIKFNMIVFCSLTVLSLANNSLSGSVPAFICNCTGIQILDLSVNNLSGSIPPCLFENGIEVLILRRNNMSGGIPDRFLLDCNLETLDLSHNNLVGHVPRSLGNCSSLAMMDVGSNHIDDIFPCMLPSSLKVLVLRSNRFRGEVRCKRSWPNLQIIDIASNNLSGCLTRSSFSRWRGMMQDSDAMSTHDTLGTTWGVYFYQDEVALIIKGLDLKLVSIWPQFTSIDFSCNNFQGDIPDSIGQLNALHLLNLSHNSLTGTIPESFSNLTQLEALDLSVNQLTGQIPKALARLTFLQIMNVSHNKLVGKIPVGSQIQTFSPDSFEWNTGLCGLPLNISCTNTPPKLGNDVQSHGNTEIEWEYVFAALGFVVGLGSIVWMLLCCRSFRVIYFEKIEDVFDNIFLRRQRKKRWRQRARRVVRNQVTRQ